MPEFKREITTGHHLRYEFELVKDDRTESLTSVLRFIVWTSQPATRFGSRILEVVESDIVATNALQRQLGRDHFPPNSVHRRDFLAIMRDARKALS